MKQVTVRMTALSNKNKSFIENFIVNKKIKSFMKQLVKSTLAVVALATLASQAVSAQSQTSNVNSRERIL